MPDPDDVRWLASTSGREVIATAQELLAAHTDPVALPGRLRAAYADLPPDLLSAALTQAVLADRAKDRLGPWASAGLLLTDAGLQQATRPAVSDHRARRLAGSGVRRLADLGCGLGLDALSAAAVGIEVSAVERDPVTAAMARVNAERMIQALPVAAPLGREAGRMDAGERAAGERPAGGAQREAEGWTPEPAKERPSVGRVRVTTGDVTKPAVLAPALADVDAAFVDPARRDPQAARRTNGQVSRRPSEPEAWSPPWSWVAELASQVPTVAKVAPGISRDLAPPGAETSWVSLDGDLVEATVWFPGLAQPGVRRRAVLLHTDRPPVEVTDPGDHDEVPPAVGAPGEWLIEPDDAVIRAGLVGHVVSAVAGRLLDPRIAYVTCDNRPDTELGRVFQVEAELPTTVKELRKDLRRRGYRNAVVKKRGMAVKPEDLRQQLGMRGSGPIATIVLTRTPRGSRTFLVTSMP